MADDRRQPDDDATRVRPALDPDATRIGGPDATRIGGPDATRISPDRVRTTYEDANRPVPPPGADRWAGSASVPPAGAAPPDTYGYDLEPLPDDQPNWMRPLLFGFVGLLLLGALLTGVWLIFTADDEPPPTPQASAPAVTSEAPPTTAAPTTATPTSEEPEPIVVVPADLIGLSEDEARQRITDAGLRVQVTRRTDATMAPGTVIEASPGPGSEVAPNSVVRIVVAEAPRPSGSDSAGTDED
jgi:PASTA domain